MPWSLTEQASMHSAPRPSPFRTRHVRSSRCKEHQDSARRLVDCPPSCTGGLHAGPDVLASFRPRLLAFLVPVLLGCILELELNSMNESLSLTMLALDHACRRCSVNLSVSADFADPLGFQGAANASRSGRVSFRAARPKRRPVSLG